MFFEIENQEDRRVLVNISNFFHFHLLKNSFIKIAIVISFPCRMESEGGGDPIYHDRTPPSRTKKNNIDF